ncbi:MAG: hypothetical protein FWC26_04570, partial [Fibromonadales bacterium]|nr:hypothetical protein [Fibromonadales bacterium]
KMERKKPIVVSVRDIRYQIPIDVKVYSKAELDIQLDTNSSADLVCERMDYLICKTREKLKTWLG